MIYMCAGAILGAATVVVLMLIFTALCIVMRALAYVLSSAFNGVLERIFTDKSMIE